MKNLPKSIAGSLAMVGPPITNNNAGDGGKTPRRLIPVLRKKRSDWVIPRINEAHLRQAEQHKLKHLQELFRGPTPTGRELYRKILNGIRHKLGRPGAGIEEVLAYARSEFRTFPSLEQEVKQLFLVARGKDVDLSSITLEGMATILVICERSRLVLFGKLATRGSREVKEVTAVIEVLARFVTASKPPVQMEELVAFVFQPYGGKPAQADPVALLHAPTRPLTWSQMDIAEAACDALHVGLARRVDQAVDQRRQSLARCQTEVVPMTPAWAPGMDDVRVASKKMLNITLLIPVGGRNSIEG